MDCIFQADIGFVTPSDRIEINHPRVILGEEFDYCRRNLVCKDLYIEDIENWV